MGGAIRVVITGPLHCGKTTALLRAVALLGLEVPGGFTTHVEEAPGGARRFLLRSWDGRERCFAEASAGASLGGFSVDLSVFETFGVLLLTEAVDAPWVVIDELGVMEQRAPVFVECVKSIFEGAERVLAVVQERTLDDWLGILPGVEEGRILRVTVRNRDEMCLRIARRAVEGRLR